MPSGNRRAMNTEDVCQRDATEASKQKATVSCSAIWGPVGLLNLYYFFLRNVEALRRDSGSSENLGHDALDLIGQHSTKETERCLWMTLRINSYTLYFVKYEQFRFSVV